MRLLAAFLIFAIGLAAPPADAGQGKKRLKEYTEANRIYQDERWQRYVRDVAARLLAHTKDADKDYVITVLDAADVNAFVTGDRHMFVSRGLLAFLETEDQLAAVLGHELGHEVAHHVRKRRVTQLAGKSLGAVAAMVTRRGELYQDVAVPVTALWSSGYGREMELEADRLGAIYMARAGYYPEAVIDVITRLKAHEDFTKKTSDKTVSYHGVFASHPRNDLRLHAVVDHARSLWQPTSAEPVGDYWEMLQGLAYGDVAAAGVVKDETFYHGALRVALTFPPGWMIGSPGAQVTASAPGGSAEGSIVAARHEPVPRKSPAEYVTDVLQRDDVKGGEEREVNGIPTFVGEIDTTDSNIQLQLIAVMQLRGNIFLFRGECGEEGDPETFRADFEQTLAGLRQMTAADVQIANSRSVEVIVAEPGDTYEALAKTSSLRSFPADRLRLLNGDYPYGEPRAGDLIKIVR